MLAQLPVSGRLTISFAITRNGVDGGKWANGRNFYGEDRSNPILWFASFDFKSDTFRGFPTIYGQVRRLRPSAKRGFVSEKNYKPFCFILY
jgi:hypothetical protein